MREAAIPQPRLLLKGGEIWDGHDFIAADVLIEGEPSAESEVLTARISSIGSHTRRTWIRWTAPDTSSCPGYATPTPIRRTCLCAASSRGSTRVIDEQWECSIRESRPG